MVKFSGYLNRNVFVMNYWFYLSQARSDVELAKSTRLLFDFLCFRYDASTELGAIYANQLFYVFLY